MAVHYRGLPPAVQLRVGAHPDNNMNWCGFTPNNYAIDVFVKGIFRDLHMAAVAKVKSQVNQPWLSAVLVEDPEAYLGNGFRHIEPGEIFPETYTDIDRADESLAPVSGHHLNIITEHDRTIEKWHVRIGHNREDFARYFKDYSTFAEFMEMLKGNMMKGIRKSLGMLVKAVMTSDPSQVHFDDKDMSRIFGRAWTFPIPQPDDNQPRLPTSELGKKWCEMMKELVNKYSTKARELWKNITWYNPYNFAWDQHAYEDMRPDDIYFTSEKATTDDKKALVQQQNLYADTHTTADHLETDRGIEGVKSKRLYDLHRNDCLFALVDAISKALNIINTEESAEFWLGYETSNKIYMGDQDKYQRWHKHMTRLGADLSGHPIPPNIDQSRTNLDSPYTYSDRDAFEVMARPDDLMLFMNPEDYIDLDIGVARRGQMDTRAVNLDMIRKYCNNIFPMRGMKPGFARLIDKRAFKIRSYFQMTDVQTPMEKLTWRYKMFYCFATSMFANFAGTLFVPTPHFVASPRYYDKYGMIGQNAIDALGLHSSSDKRE